jgi:hypothetical protein
MGPGTAAQRFVLRCIRGTPNPTPQIQSELQP